MGIKTDEMVPTYTASMASPGHEVAGTPLIGKLGLHIQGYVGHEEFYIQPLEGCDVLLGMPWFYNHKAVLDSFNKLVTLEIRGREIVLDVKLKGESVPLVSSSAVPTLMKQHISAYLIYVKERDETESSNLSSLDVSTCLFGRVKPKYKARLVAKGFKQQQDIDFDEIFSLVVKMTTLRCVLALVAKEDMELVQMEIKTAFLHGDLHENMYKQQPKKFVLKGKEHSVCKLKKSIYGLNQAPREWYHKFHTFMLSQGYRRSDIDHCLYTKGAKDVSLLILILYVDDMLLAGKNIDNLAALQSKLNDNFDMKDLGDANHILGMWIVRDKDKRFLRVSSRSRGDVRSVCSRFVVEKGAYGFSCCIIRRA
ncbi:hypothetical protein L7F22_022990 [Adiantum nelumboides]|nr:hypothetical protein [Adiantum nelumboides]